MKDYWTLAFVWGITVWFAYTMETIWWKAVRTGRWLKGGGCYLYFPTKYQTFTVYDRDNNPFLYWTGIIGIPVIFGFLLFTCLLVTMGTLSTWQKTL